MKIVQISDLHFGCLSVPAVVALVAALREQAPDLVIASGDITQSATTEEFAAARAFFDGLNAPLFVIPGNHDLPGMDPMRFIKPFGRYRRHVSRDLEPDFRSEVVDIKGINSARMIMPHWNWANGAVSARQRRDIVAFFEASTAPWRMFVMHHPLVGAKELPLDVAVFGQDAALETLARQRVDLVLAGHQHHAFVEPVERDGHTTLFVNAGTTTSQRLRRQPNGFNLLAFTPTTVRIDMLRLNGERFETFAAVTHTKAGTGPTEPPRTVAP